MDFQNRSGPMLATQDCGRCLTAMPPLTPKSTTVQAHYDRVLAAIYSWTLGDFDTRVAGSVALLQSRLPALMSSGTPRRALDLGCGTGVQTLALLQLGYSVTGIDFSAEILKEYRMRTVGRDVTTIQGDISAFDAGDGYDVVVCFGDTVAHLQSWDAVRAMFTCVFASLRPNGTFFLASRDHSRVYVGDERFLLIQADATQSLTCFVEDAGAHIRITDIVHSRVDNATTLTAGSYTKLRVAPETLAAELEPRRALARSQALAAPARKHGAANGPT
jgi:2-polyprenyl-3-methyl-5-hydroxy-6-metoxy-1,4-benzoquinol methylase